MPPELDDNIQDMASSAVTEQDEQAVAAKADEQPNDAATSTATDENDTSLLSVVRDVVKDSRGAEPASSAEGDENGESEDAGATKGDDDYSDVPFNKHPRFRELVQERKTLKQEAERFKQDADRYNNVQNFMDSQGINADEAAELLIIGGLIKTNPQEAWKRIKPKVQQLLIAAGEVLPDDLNERVQKGEMSQEAALEVSRSRASVSSVEATRSFEQRRSEENRKREANTANMQAAEDWFQARVKKDPLFKAKEQPLMDRVYALQRREGIPTTPEGVREQLNRAYKGLVPAAAKSTVAPQAKTPVRGGVVAGNQQAEPKSVLDIVRANRRTA